MFNDLKNDLGKQYLLSLLNENNKKPIKGKTRLMKELFFISKNVPSLDYSLEFEPNNYGPSSDVIIGYIDEMSQIGLITKTSLGSHNVEYSLGEYGEMFLEKEYLNLDYDLIAEIKFLCDGLTNDELLALTYFSFPEMTEESLVLSKIENKRDKLALGLYMKGKVSLEKAVEISKLSYIDFLELLESKKISVELLL